MIQALLSDQSWTNAPAWRREQSGKVPATVLNVLLVTQSLTRFLEKKYRLKLDVHLHEQMMDYADTVEAGLLQVAGASRCLRRKVSLLSRNEVMFDAESVLPLDVLPVSLVQELASGKRPLANLLSDRGLQLSRSDLGITKISDHVLYAGNWARRSVLRAASGETALVTEVFHDAIWRKLDYMQKPY